MDTKLGEIINIPDDEYTAIKALYISWLYASYGTMTAIEREAHAHAKLFNALDKITMSLDYKRRSYALKLIEASDDSRLVIEDRGPLTNNSMSRGHTALVANHECKEVERAREVMIHNTIVGIFSCIQHERDDKKLEESITDSIKILVNALEQNAKY